MKFLRSVRNCSREGRIRNENIWEELNIQRIIQQADIYKSRWKDYLMRILSNRLSKQALNYQPIGRISVGRLRTRCEARTGNLHNSGTADNNGDKN